MAKEALESKMSSLSPSCLLDKVRALPSALLFPTRSGLLKPHIICACDFSPVHDDQPGRRARLLQHDAGRELVVGNGDAEQAGGQEETAAAAAASQQLRLDVARVGRRLRGLLARGRGGEQQEAAAGAAGRRRPMRSTARRRDTTVFFAGCPVPCRGPGGTNLLHQMQFFFPQL